MREFATDDGQPVFDEETLLAKAQKGDRKAYGLVVEHYRERLFCAALGIVRNHEDARDMSQDAFVRAFQSLDRFELKRPFYPWLYRILRNRCLDYLERHGPRRSVSLDALIEDNHAKFAAEVEDPRERIHKQQMAARLHEAIDELKPEFREIVIMKHLQEMPYKDIAEALEIPMGTVMSRLFHARKALAKLMEPHRAR